MSPEVVWILVGCGAVAALLAAWNDEIGSRPRPSHPWLEEPPD